MRQNQREQFVTKPPYRSEYKYVVSTREQIILRNRLKGIMAMDTHSSKEGSYVINSLYFDTFYDRALQEKLAGVRVREKYRIRYYNNDTSFIRLEKKCKHCGRTLKYSTPISYRQAMQLLQKDVSSLQNSSDDLLQEFCIKLTTEHYIPKTIVQYTREAFCFPISNVRITLDSNLKSSTTFLQQDFLPGTLVAPTMNCNQCIVEVKFDHFLPEFIQDVIQLSNTHHSAASKYAACRVFH